MKKCISVFLLALLLCGCGGGQTDTPAPPAETAAPAEEYEGLRFSTTDREGKDWDESSFASYKIIMLNFFEPWCGPCVAELPALQKLSENYADEGLLLLGVYLTEDGMEELISQMGVTYPILHYTEALYGYTTAYVPTTVFLSPQGKLLKQVASAKSYDSWEALLLELMNPEER